MNGSGATATASNTMNPNNNINNNNSNGNNNNGINTDMSKKSRESRLTNRVNSPVSIKIEDDSDTEEYNGLQQKVSDVSLSSDVPIAESDANNKGVQTDDAVLKEMLRKIVQDRMLQVTLAYVFFIAKYLSGRV